MNIGLIWDVYDSRLKAQVLTDLIALRSECGLVGVMISAPQGEDAGWVRSQLSTLDLVELTGEPPTVWRAYAIKEEPVMPDSCQDWIFKDLRIVVKEQMPWTPGGSDYLVLDRQSDTRLAPLPTTIDLNQPSPPRPKGNNKSVVLPRNYLYSPFI
jgi:hypothetical protein